MSESTMTTEQAFERFIAALGTRRRLSAAERANWANDIRAAHADWVESRAPKDFLDTCRPRTLVESLEITLGVPRFAAIQAARWAKLSIEDHPVDIQQVAHVGVTATRCELTAQQRQWLEGILHRLYTPTAELHHGDCIGGDEFAARSGTKIGYRVVSHPPTNARLRAYAPSHEVLPAQPYLRRNDAIARACTVLVAVPPGPEDLHPRSGTWYTVRAARRAGREVIVWASARGEPAW